MVVPVPGSYRVPIFSSYSTDQHLIPFPGDSIHLWENNPISGFTDWHSPVHGDKLIIEGKYIGMAVCDVYEVLTPL